VTNAEAAGVSAADTTGTVTFAGASTKTKRLWRLMFELSYLNKVYFLGILSGRKDIMLN
jgi:hypothetical protein